MLVLCNGSEVLCNGSAAFVVGPNAGLFAPGSIPVTIPYFKGFATVGFCARRRFEQTHMARMLMHMHMRATSACVC